ncbi:hypothetical protein HYFRA_00006255 [Hymenoscyphus fraxineus]|uniref:Exonuclease domain-containing protein n=1 Tax=Hymenoscyphus fraxineus TaxID=746836 RepID=A0A9N9PZR7_9HELO|nr:hypothetical protein HYFRA_00006255 [Hymenoscyphus fraxineus]
MAGVSTGGPGEAILLCAADYLTGTVLINKYISPPEKITTMRTSIHGISRTTLNTAIQRGTALAGWPAARAELWKFIDEKTILIGHALEHDLNSLRLIHPRIVDSGVLVRNIVGCTVGLKVLCGELVGIGIRRNKGGVHDCLEDVWATREVVLFCTRERRVFRVWGEGRREVEEGKRVERVRRNEEARMAKMEVQARAGEGMSEGEALRIRGGEEMVRRVAEKREERRERDRWARERKEGDGKREREEEALKVFKRTAESRGFSVS